MKNQFQVPDFGKHMKQYEDYVRAKGFKSDNYIAPVREFLHWLQRRGHYNIRTVSSKEAIRYCEYLSERPNKRRGGVLAPKTVKAHLFALSMFVNNLLLLGELKKGFAVPEFSGDEQQLRQVLTVDEVKILYEHAHNELEIALLSVAYGCGLRRSEMENLNISDVQLAAGMLIVRCGKGDKRREVPMSDVVLQSLRRYATAYRYQLLAK